MENADHNSLYTEIRVLSELLKSFRIYTEEKLKPIQELQDRVTVINTRCNEKTCVYDKTLEKYEYLKESFSKLDSEIEHFEGRLREVKEQLDGIKDAEQKRLSDTLVKTEDTLEKTRDKTSNAIWKIIPIVVSIASIIVVLFLK